MEKQTENRSQASKQPSSISYDAKGNAVTFKGPDAVDLYRAGLLWMHIGLWIKTKMVPTRGFTITKMLAAAGEYTGKKYTHKQAEQARADLKVWMDTMKAALPAEERA